MKYADRCKLQITILDRTFIDQFNNLYCQMESVFLTTVLDN